MDTGLNTPSKRSAVIAEHLLNNYGRAKNYNDSHFSFLSKIRNKHTYKNKISDKLEKIFITTYKIRFINVMLRTLGFYVFINKDSKTLRWYLLRVLLKIEKWLLL